MNLVKRECRYCHNNYDEKPKIPKYARVCPECRRRGLKGKLDKEIKEKSLKKRRETNLKRYGVDNPSKNEEIQNKIKETNLEKYGVEYITQVDSIKDKIKTTNLKRYGGHPQQNKEIRNKVKKTNLKKYGVEYTFQADFVKEKIKKTMIKKYDVDHFSKSSQFKTKIKETVLEKMVPNILEILDERHMKLVGEYSHANDIIDIQCLVCNKIFKTRWNYIQQGYKCPFCYPKNVSKNELELQEFLRDNNLFIITSDRSIIKPKELDIYIPSKNIAIEFNGLYWHSELFGCDKNYHIDKTIKCKEKGIQLIHIFEDEWENKKEIVKHRLLQILNRSESKRIHARKCFIREISSNSKDDFLNKFHIQGKDNSKIKLGAYYNNELVAVMTFSHGNISKGSKSKKDIWELNRFCVDYNYHIPGIAGKLLKYFQRNFKWKEIFSYADRRWSQGNVYYKLGFELDHETKPNYWYVKNNVRIHRFSLRKNVNNPDNLPEKIIRKQQGYIKIWDCGNLKFKMMCDTYKDLLIFE